MSDQQMTLKDSFDALLSLSSDLVLVVEEEIVTRVSPGDEDWLIVNELIGKPLEDIFPADYLTLIRGYIETARQHGQVVKNELVFRPDHQHALKAMGLKEVIWFHSRMIVTESEQLIWSLRNINDRKKLERRITSQAQRDPLTGAYNRRALMPLLEQNLAQAQRYDGVCSALIVDIDDFSGINDQHSWDGGDQLLRHMVTELHRMKRTADFLARFSDDQLILVLPETNHEQALLAGERVRRLANSLELPYASGNIHCTVSVGVATLAGLEDTAEDMLRRIQENLAVARQSGGDRVEGESF
ncbi:GGDEF domain-containing protein [Nitrincola schmidtii]|uniref:GGDEF domain-containing protein n=1 Tax=Nitrincola schmidtii TaxID=1730894 RepID=UPI00124F333E|nr:GGDEF domain-containing protein [Nitrincola schmidtii]